MKTDFSKHIVCDDGNEREFHFARVNSAAIYYHVSVVDVDEKLYTATVVLDDNSKWKIQPDNFPSWLFNVEPKLAEVIEAEEKQTT